MSKNQNFEGIHKSTMQRHIRGPIRGDHNDLSKGDQAITLDRRILQSYFAVLLENGETEEEGKN